MAIYGYVKKRIYNNNVSSSHLILSVGPPDTEGRPNSHTQSNRTTDVHQNVTDGMHTCVTTQSPNDEETQRTMIHIPNYIIKSIVEEVETKLDLKLQHLILKIDKIAERVEQHDSIIGRESAPTNHQIN